LPSARSEVGKLPLRRRPFTMKPIAQNVLATKGEFSTALCAFINHELPPLHSRMRAEPGVTPETPLFATGLIDSMAILHVIAFVEDATGRPISPEQVVMKHFATVAAITETFWRPAADALR
jgi:acyl carrier protein